jgi:predicted ATPase
LNGIRVATKNGPLTPEQSKIYYFRKDKDELETKIDEINIDKEGGKDSYPKGFFDQFDDDLDELLGL